MSVAIIIAAYNAEATIKRAIISVLAEPEVTQIIVVDDASTDGTLSKAMSADDGSGRLYVLRQDKNKGPSAARNQAIEAATADWIGIVDADDFLLPGRISGLLKFSDSTDLVADNLWQVDEDCVDGPRTLLLPETSGKARLIGFDEFVLSNVTRKGRQRGEMGFIKPLMRRQFLTHHKLRYCEDLRLGEDFELYARALALGARLILVPPQGYVSVIRANSLSGQHSSADLLALRESDCALAQIPTLSAHNKKALRRHYSSVDCRLQWRLLIEAVKARDAKAAMATFLRPPPVLLYLLQRLAEQIYFRLIKR